MTTLTHSTVSAQISTDRKYAPTGSGLSFVGLMRSEWIKLWSVRSTVWLLSVAVVVSLGMAAVTAWATTLQISSMGGPSDLSTLPAADQAGIILQASTFGVFFGQLIVAVLGVLVISGEYSTGMIMSTLTAVPRRLGALAAKGVVLFAVTFLVGVVSTVGSFLVATPMLAGLGLSSSLLDPAISLPLLGASLYLALVAVFALGIGTVVRSAAFGISAALGTLLVLPIGLSMIPAPWATDVSPYLLSNAGTSLFSTTAGMEPGQGVLVVLGWVVASVGVAAVLLKKHDA
ncbi:ABC transporter permease [Cryobacterium sp. CG_9.6]|uniref:ABC transporter permease n=1 Tax=Cryobacterium sp. CG_9.6 TaxID=2760710 RepID=UPI00247328B8|nr:ABC transporter permease [Cryobacterium sp. CG_9.6]MDH6238289.1 ABC-2 type transport system permease protein [Cryobacterium sp. CG_9.6]